MLGQAKLDPFPYEPGGSRTDDLDITCWIEGPTGRINLEDGISYAIHADSFAEKQQTYRRREVTSPYVEGTFPLVATRENVTEPLVVWVNGRSNYDFKTKALALTEALDQLSFRVMIRIEDSVEYWDCWASDHSVQTQREFIHAKMGIVRATVSHLPAVQLVPASADEA